MKWFQNMKISLKLIIGFILVAIIAGVVGITGISNIRKIERLDTQMYEKHTATLDDLVVFTESYQQMRTNLRDIIIKKDSSILADHKKMIEEYDKTCRTSMDNFEKGIVSDEVRELFTTLKDQYINYLMPYINEIISMAESGDYDGAVSALYGKGGDTTETIKTAIESLIQLKVETAKNTSDSNTRVANRAVVIMIIVIVGGVILAILLGLFIAGSISRPINNMVKAAEGLALGDVNVEVKADSKDETGILAEAFRKMIANIRYQAMIAEKIADGDLTVNVKIRSEVDVLGKQLVEMVNKNNNVLTNISSASKQVAVGAKQVSDSSMALSQGATEQASSIEELTASIEEISSQTKLNAENANQANQFAENAKEKAVQGNMHMKEMLNAMEDISSSSSSISKIIKVIDDIAFQTNILALNAAVEAARAGQHGKGFAVVAEEVRNLAARSANAAKETTDMIEDCIKKTEDGSKIAKDTADALGIIVNGIQSVAELIGNIAISSNEQATGIAQVNQGLMQVSQVIQNNTATSEESAAASEELSSQAELLREMVGEFKLRDNTKDYNGKEDNIQETHKLQETKKKAKKPSIALSDYEFGKY